MADADSSTRGLCCARAIHATSSCVSATRLRRKAALRASVQRLPTMRAPARLTTMSMRCASDNSSSDRMQRTWPSKVHAACFGWRVSTVTAWPSASKALTSCWPMKPVAPVTSTDCGVLANCRCSVSFSSCTLRRPSCHTAYASRRPDRPTPTPHRARKTLSQPYGCHTRAVGKVAHSLLFRASSAMKAPALIASTVCVTRSVAGKRRVWSSTTKSHNVSTISTPNTITSTQAQAPCHSQAARPTNSRL